MDFSNLNEKQIEAVKQIEGPVLILAGAGSGKTTTMTYRIAYMIEQGIDPSSILAVTFTNKAADEMRSRVVNLTGRLRGMWIMTFHAACLRILKQNPEAIGYKPGFTVYDETDKKALIKRILKDGNIDEKMFPVSMITSVISNCKEKEEGPDDYLSSSAGDFKTRTIYDVYSNYQAALIKNNAMDFDDLLLNAVKLLESNRVVLEYYRSRFKYVMVDEYQDTNYLQYKFVQLLSGKSRNLCVVGDDDQCIYEWRGADITNILNFEKYFPEARVIKLEQNYRSDANILGLANSVIKNNKGRKSKALWTEKAPDKKVLYRRLDNEKGEARFIADMVQQYHDDGYKYSDIAILYRKNVQSRPFEDRFSFRGIPYRVLSGMKFYERKEIKDMLSYLRLIENPNDDTAMLRIINEPKRGVGDKTLSGIRSYAKAFNCSIYEAIKIDEVRGGLSVKAKSELGSLVKMIEELRTEKDNLAISDIYDNLLVRSGYLKALENANTVESDARIENIMEFRSVIEEFEKSFAGSGEDEADDVFSAGSIEEGMSLLGVFLDSIALMSDADGVSDEDCVCLMTFHSAKGLEFPVVFMTGMENNLFPSDKSISEQNKLEEERRLCYVGITRAKEKLILTGAEMRMLYGRTDYCTESMFLDEMDPLFMEGDKTVKQRMKLRSTEDNDGVFGNYYIKGHTHGTADGYAGKAHDKPFDTVKYAAREVKKKVSNENFSIGDTLEHPKFGRGVLIDQNEKIMSIMFDSVGLKKIGKGFVNIKKVDE